MYEIKRSSDTIIEVVVSGEYTIDEAEKLNNELVQLLESYPNPISLIMNLADMTKFPSDISKVSKVSQPIAKSDKIKTVVIVMKNNPILKFVTNIVTNLFKQPYKMVGSRAEAETHLQSIGEIV